MDNFSIIDQIRACLPCLRPPAVDGDDDALGAGRGVPELDRLLFDTEHDTTDAEADAMSLHSNMGATRSKKHKKRGKRRINGAKSVRLFGYDLFGRPRPLSPSPPASEDESSALVPPNHPSRSRSTSGSLDPDAAPLPEAAIANLSRHASKWTPPLTDEQIAIEEQKQREKEERRAKRALRQLRKQHAVATNSEELGPSSAVESGEFEGFPGGNATLARDAFHPTPMQFEDDGEFGPYVEVPRGGPEEANHEESDDEVDVGGEYNRRSRKPTNSGSGDGSSSRSRSYKSSIADGSLYVPPHTRRSKPHGLNLIQQQQAPHNIPLPLSSAGGSQPDLEPPPLRLKKSRSKGRSSHSQSSASTSHPPSTPSPGPGSISSAHIHSEGNLIFQVGADRLEPSIPPLHPPDVVSSGFPSTGFGGVNGKRSGLRGGQGVALARTGD